MSSHTPERTVRRPVVRILRQFQQFVKLESFGGVLLLIATIIALAWANSPWAGSYTRLWQTPVTVGAGGFMLSKPLLLWINDGLMAIFFFVVGLEIKRELLVGELSAPRKAMLPIVAALGGMLTPAIIFTLFNLGTPIMRGWAIPTATDIAFALGVLALLGERAPLAIKVFLTALAIIDDLGAVLIIALFYTGDLSWANLAVGGFFLLLLVGANGLGARKPLPYMLLGAGMWVAFLKSGVHPTIAGVLAAMTIPARARCDTDEYLEHTRSLLDAFGRVGKSSRREPLTEEHQAYLHALEVATEDVQTPMQRMEHALHPWVIYFIMPVFALANAGVAIDTSTVESIGQPMSLGIILGLFLGKQLGITLFSWVSVRLGLAALPSGITWRHVYGAACLAGIGFTMSLFIAELAFGGTFRLPLAKMDILIGSLVSGIFGFLFLRYAVPIREPKKSLATVKR
ncbi:MAG TPA: Na+/H+ antiporter NhaA [Chthonomonadales bacterium]|nr:Na+/H+ antiporter NhaA [Chthonomonadales bacterium]